MYDDTADPEPAVGNTSCRIKVHAGEPIFVNPKSYASVVKVFQQIGKQVGVNMFQEEKESGQWLLAMDFHSS